MKRHIFGRTVAHAANMGIFRSWADGSRVSAVAASVVSSSGRTSIESDFLKFNSGAIATIGIAIEKANRVTNQRKKGT